MEPECRLFFLKNPCYGSTERVRTHLLFENNLPGIWNLKVLLRDNPYDIFCLFSSSSNRCPYPEHTFHCNASEVCIPQQFVCDGKIQCEAEAEDENFDLCVARKAFHDDATFKCLENHRTTINKTIYDNHQILYNITILAVPCNGINECKDEEDEKNCAKFGIEHLILGAFVAYVTIILVMLVLQKFLHHDEYLANPDLEMAQLGIQNDSFEQWHNTPEMMLNLTLNEVSKDRKMANQGFFAFELNHHNQDLAEVVCCVKVSDFVFIFLHPTYSI